MKYPYQNLTHRIIKSFYTVYNDLGYGFLEKVYERAMLVELRNQGLVAMAQSPFVIRYRGEFVGRYLADIVVEDKVILEIKAVESLTDGHEAQLLNYLKETNIEIGLLMNFGKSPKILRRIYTNDRKNNPRHPSV